MSATLQRIDATQPGAALAIAALRAKLSPAGNVVSEAGRQRTIDVFGEPVSPQQVVERICGEVRQRGMPALLDYTAKLDKADLTAETLRVPAAELAAAHESVEPEFLATIRRIRENILRFQTAILHQDVAIDIPGGGSLRQRYVPLARVGCCVPGGAAAYPSTVLMTVLPAQAAGVQEIVVVAPPTPFGAYNNHLLAVCRELGVTEVYRMGGAQAVAAMAYGVEGIRRVDKIVGPGNLFVALAKKLVYGDVDIDSIAGPSEVVIVADDTARADFIAADLIAQAEHSPGASILITPSELLIEAVVAELAAQLSQLDRGDLARASLCEFGAMIMVADNRQAAQLANEFAPEHLHLQTDQDEALLAQIPSAGAAFMGSYTPVAVGDYAAGPSHVLPTSGTARFASGLSSNDFLRAGSVLQFSPDALAKLAADVELLAQTEGLTAHAASVAIRNSAPGDG
jgi:histidinol dehydrogenase